MASNNPHLLKRHSLFAMFCLSYIPLFILLAVKIISANEAYLIYGGINKHAFFIFFKHFGLVPVIVLLSCYGLLGTKVTFRNIKQKEANAFPVKINSIKPKNEESLSYLSSYVIPLLIKGEIGYFEYATLIILFIIYFKLYSTSSLILINPLLNMKYGLYEIEYQHLDNSKEKKVKNARIISNQQWLNDDDDLKLIKLGHCLYFAF